MEAGPSYDKALSFHCEFGYPIYCLLLALDMAFDKALVSGVWALTHLPQIVTAIDCKEMSLSYFVGYPSCTICRIICTAYQYFFNITLAPY